jgi:hypothetical protein
VKSYCAQYGRYRQSGINEEDYPRGRAKAAGGIWFIRSCELGRQFSDRTRLHPSGKFRMPDKLLLPRRRVKKFLD